MTTMNEATLEQRLAQIDRTSDRSLIDQIVAAVLGAIAAGELTAGMKLPPTRRLAQLAGVNQLTAGRSYRRLAERGAVVSEVGRGTFVRAGTAAHGETRSPSETSWQTYVLEPERPSAAAWILAELAALSGDSSRDPIALSVGHPPGELVPAELLEAAATIARAGAASFAYGPVAGDEALRNELARLGRLRGLEDDPSSILVTTGARQAITLATRVVLRPGDKVACESPTYMGVIDALQVVGAEVLPVPVGANGFDMDALEELLRRHEIRMVALQPRLQNPTGRDLSASGRERLVELARQHGFFILEDAVYADLRFSGTDPGPLRALAPAHVLYIDSFSKTVAPGLRAGWIAASGPVLERLIAEKRSDDTHGALLPQKMVASFLADGHYAAQLERARSLYRERRDVLMNAVDRELGDLVSYTRPAGGGHLWLTLEQPCDDSRLYHDALAAGVSFVPGSTMTVGRPQETYLRLSFGLLEPEAIRTGVRRLAGVIRAHRDELPALASLPVN